MGHVGVFGSNEFDNAGNIGALFEFRVHPRVGVEFEGNKMLGLTPRAVPCSLSVPCTGSAVEGPRSAFHYSGNMLFYFSSAGRLQPYVLAGLGGLHSRTAHSVTLAGPAGARIIQEADTTDSGVSIGFGGGLRIPLGSRFSIRPDLRLYDSSIRSRANLGFIQIGVLAGYQF
jgi:hypothetical protein